MDKKVTITICSEEQSSHNVSNNIVSFESFNLSLICSSLSSTESSLIVTLVSYGFNKIMRCKTRFIAFNNSYGLWFSNVSLSMGIDHCSTRGDTGLVKCF